MSKEREHMVDPVVSQYMRKLQEKSAKARRALGKEHFVKSTEKARIALAEKRQKRALEKENKE